MDLKLLFTLLTEFIGKEAFESDFYKDALEPKLCQKQLQNIVNDPWLLMDCKFFFYFLLDLGPE